MDKTLIIPIRIAAEVVAIHITDDPETADALYDGDHIGIGSIRPGPDAGGDPVEFYVIAELTRYGYTRERKPPPED